MNRLDVLVHEVRSSVAALSAIAQTYSDPRLAAAGRHSLVELALAACRGIERLVTDAAVASVRLEKVDVGRIVEESVAAALLVGIKVQAAVPSRLPLINADPLRLRQALDNLIRNAHVHASGSEIVVSLTRAESAVLLAVTDAGPGVPADTRDRIFEAGERLDGGQPGSGLGLTVTRTIAEAHGGTLTVESVPGRGATFTLGIPER